MPKITKPLTDTEIKNAKSKDKDYALFDGQGLFLLVKKNGSKIWRFNFTFNQKRNTMSFNHYPDISLKEARNMRDKAKENIKERINPVESKISNFVITNTFKAVSEKWLDIMKDGWSDSNYKKIKSNFENNAFSFIGNRDLKDIRRKDILILIERMEKRSATEYASRLLNNIQRMYKYAVTNEYIEFNPVSDIDKANSLKKRQKTNIPALTKKEDIKQLLSDIKNYGTNFKSDISTIYALKLAPYVALRPYNLRFLEWCEIDFEKKLIDIPKEKMKMDIDFILPLSKQALEILEEVKQFKSSDYVFPSASSNSKAISENTLNHALHRMGYKGVHTGHGFRSSFSTNAHELRSEHGLNSDVIESCLAHTEQNSVKAAYNRIDKYKYLDEKIKLMEFWANWLDKL